MVVFALGVGALDVAPHPDALGRRTRPVERRRVPGILAGSQLDQRQQPQEPS